MDHLNITVMNNALPPGQSPADSGPGIRNSGGADKEDTVMDDDGSPLSDPPRSESGMDAEPGSAREASSQNPQADPQAVQNAMETQCDGIDRLPGNKPATPFNGSSDKVHATRRNSPRKAASQLENVGDELISNSEPVLKKTRIILKNLSSVRKGHSKWDNVDTILTDWNSPLGKTKKLRDLLLSPQAWDVLDREDKDKVLRLLPDSAEIVDSGTDLARPDVKKLLNNDNFSYDVAHYQRDLREGRHDPEWIRQAQAAHGLRAAGHYDEYLAAKFEEDWGIKIPGHDEDEDMAGQSADSCTTPNSRGVSAEEREGQMTQASKDSC